MISYIYSYFFKFELFEGLFRVETIWYPIGIVVCTLIFILFIIKRKKISNLFIFVLCVVCKNNSLVVAKQGNYKNTHTKPIPEHTFFFLLSLFKNKRRKKSNRSMTVFYFSLHKELVRATLLLWIKLEVVYSKTTTTQEWWPSTKYWRLKSIFADFFVGFYTREEWCVKKHVYSVHFCPKKEEILH